MTRWLRALEVVARIPPEIVDRRVDRIEALRLLRCDEGVLDTLVAHGLAYLSVGGEQNFSWYDVMNIGLYSQSRRSVAELAEVFLVRFARGSVDSLLQERSWRLQLAAHCALGRHRRGAWRLRRPAPELHGGQGAPWTQLPQQTDASAGPDHGSIRAELRVRTCGQPNSVRSHLVRDLYRDALESIARHQWRFQYIPLELRSNPELAVTIGAMDCMSTSLLLVERCEHAGIEARTRKGYILLVNSIEHVWLEVRDEDGVFKPVDPMLAALALRHHGTNADVTEFMLGSLSSRLLPWDADAHTELFPHDCDHAEAWHGCGTPPVIALSATPDDSGPLRALQHEQGGREERLQGD